METEKHHKFKNLKPEEELTTADNQIQSVVAVMSGKGGVGKSFITGLLACALAKAGYRVGILDADITGASIPRLFGLQGALQADGRGVQPRRSRLGIKMVSINFLLPRDDFPLAWKGTMISQSIQTFWEEVIWGPLDYLLVDMPSGTSDAALTVLQSLPVKGVVMVTTPQGLAAMVVNKAVHMAHEVGVPVIGVVNNMAYYQCPDTHQKHQIFGPGHSQSVAQAAQAPLWEQIPLAPFIAEQCDAGTVEDIDLDEASRLVEKFVQAVSDLGERIQAPQTASPGAGAEAAGEGQAAAYRANQSPFSEKVLHLMKTKENIGCFQNPDARGYFLGRCGDRMQIDLRLAGNMIVEARFMTDGCGATAACGSMVTQLAHSKSLEQAMQITPDDLLDALDGLPEDHVHCAELAVMTLREAVIDAVEGHGVVKNNRLAK